MHGYLEIMIAIITNSLITDIMQLFDIKETMAFSNVFKQSVFKSVMRCEIDVSQGCDLKWVCGSTTQTLDGL